MHNKILIVGNFNWYFYEDALIDGFKSINYDVKKFKLDNTGFFYKFYCYKKIKKTNTELIKFIDENLPDVVLFYRTNEIFPTTLKHIKKLHPKLKLLFFHNDNPFYGIKHKFKYFLYLKCLQYSDITYVYRPSNIRDALKIKAKNVQLLYPYYCTKIHLSNKINHKNKINDIVFIGYCETHRVKLINALIKADIDVKVFGPGWSKIAKKLKWPNSVINGPVYGVEYTKIISESKMALCFLSKINNDVYTRRNFEIPAIGTIVVSEFTKELSELFIQDKEIILFKDSIELVQKVKILLSNDQHIKKVTLAGHKKVINGRYSEIDRALQIQKDIDSLNHE
jgi:spore maturation protein CgeB